jgi:glycosidase
MNTLSRFSIVLLAALTLACSASDIPSESDIPGLASPIQLQFDSTTVVMADFFMHPEKIDSIHVGKGLDYQVKGDFEEVVLTGKPVNALSLLTVWMSGDRYDILLKRTEKEKVALRYPYKSGINRVFVKGEMNSWNPAADELVRKGVYFEVSLLLNPGIYQYQFLVDGKETLDPENPVQVPNGIGGINSQITVGNVDGDDKPELSTHKYNSNRIELEADDAEETFVFWQNYALQVDTDDDGEEVVVNLPVEAAKMERSFVRAWSYNEAGISNDVLIPLHYGKVLKNPDLLKRQDYQAWNMYMVLIDRFKDGNPNNNEQVDDPMIRPEVNYYGGDLAGITQAIQDGYFQDLGINALWLSPITQNPETAYGLWDEGGVTTKFSGYHGYWPISSSKIDYRYGTEDEFRELIDIAHENGIAIIVDYVANHVHEEHPVYQNNPDWATDLYLPDGTENTQKWDEYRLTTWFDTFMPSLDFSNPEVVEVMTDSALFWLKNYEIDGFRHDATKHINLEFWRTLTRKVKEEVVTEKGQPVYQIGETYGSRELIASYINSGMLDSQFDFSMFDAAQTTFGQDRDFEMLQAQMNQTLKYYGNHNVMGYISGNHDKARFISLTSGEVKWSEDPKLAAWTRKIPHPQEFAYDKLKLLFAWNMTIPGIPVTYYGDEFGMPGAGDPDNRRWMIFDDAELNEQELENKQVTRKLMKLRNSSMPLLYGDFSFDLVEADQMAYSRAYFDEIVITVLNKDAAEAELEIDLRDDFDYKKLKARFGHDFRVDDEILYITLPANSFEILTL